MKLTRREMMAAALAAPLAAAPRYAPTLAIATYVWSQHLGRQKKAVRDNLEEIVSGCAKAGYRRIELTSDYFDPAIADKTMALLRQYKFTLPVVYHGGPLHIEAEAEKVIARSIEIVERVKSLGLVALNTNPNPKPKKEHKTDAELRVEAATIDKLGAEMHKRGLRLFVHQHDVEMAANAREWRYVMQHTDPKRVEYCLDVHWVLRGGQDVMTLLKECTPRLGSLHLRNSKKGVWMEDFGPGDIDYAQVAAHLKKAGFRGLLSVELAYDKDTPITRPIVESLKLSRIYTEKTFRVKA